MCHERKRKLAVLYQRWEWASRSRFAGTDFKPPSAAAFKRRGGERSNINLIAIPGKTHQFFVRHLIEANTAIDNRLQRGSRIHRASRIVGKTEVNDDTLQDIDAAIAPDCAAHSSSALVRQMSSIFAIRERAEPAE